MGLAKTFIQNRVKKWSNQGQINGSLLHICGVHRVLLLFKQHARAEKKKSIFMIVSHKFVKSFIQLSLLHFFFFH